MIKITALLLHNKNIKEAKKRIAEWRALLAKKEEEITALQRQMYWLSQQLRLTQRQCFSTRTKPR